MSSANARLFFRGYCTASHSRLYTFSSLTDKPQVGLNIEFFSYFVLAVSKQQGFFILLTQEWSQREIYQDF